MEVKFLGTRGSMPTGGEEFLKYGCDTSSYLVNTKETAIFLDAGTGICHAPEIEGKKIVVFLSHLHLDHIMGLAFFPVLSKCVELDIYSGLESDEIQTMLDRVFSNPFWPCKLSDFEASIHFKKIEEKQEFGDVTVFAIDGSHPGGCKVLRVQSGDKSVCYATDYEHGNRDSKLIKFAKDSDILIYDGQYTMEEYEKFKGYGHSTKEHGISIAKAAGAYRLICTHHDPRHKDEFLTKEELRIQEMFENVQLAKQGDVVKL